LPTFLSASSTSAGRRKTHPGPLPLPPDAAGGQGPDDPGQPRLPPPRRRRLPGRLRRARGEDPRPLRGHHRDRPLHRAGRAGHDPRALPVGAPSVLDREQRVLPPRTESDRPAYRTVPERGHGAHTRPRVVAEPTGGVLLHHPAESAPPTTSPTSAWSNRAWQTSNAVTTKPPDRSNGSSPPPTSQTCWTASTDTSPPTRPSRPSHEQPDPTPDELTTLTT
jgi:hypothetical protein